MAILRCVLREGKETIMQKYNPDRKITVNGREIECSAGLRDYVYVRDCGEYADAIAAHPSA